MTHSLLGITLGLMTFAVVNGQQPVVELLADINQSPGVDPGSDPGPPVVVGSDVYFTAPSTASGDGIWVSRSSGAPTLVTSLIQSQFPIRRNLYGALGKVFYFFDQRGLHVLDPATGLSTRLGTGLAHDDYKIVGVGNQVMCFCYSGGSGWGVWRSDGTPSGTRLLPVLPGVAMVPMALVPVGNEMFVLSQSSGGFQQLFTRTDGTAGGTITFLAVPTSQLEVIEDRYAAAGNVMLFAGRDGSQVTELWRTDGTSAGTLKVPSALSIIDPDGFVPIGNEVVFSAVDANTSRVGVYVSDGTGPGTRRVSNASQDVRGAQFVECGGEIYFLNVATAGSPGLFATDGVGTRLVLGYSVPAGRVLPDPHLVVAGSSLLFSRLGTGANAGLELWRSDGTTAGTVHAADLPGTTTAPGIREMVGVGSSVYLSYDDGQIGSEPWASDGTNSGTGSLANLLLPSTNAGSDPRSYVDVGALAWFSADDGAGRDLWSTDATSAGTQKRAGLAAANSTPDPVAEVGNKLVFSAGSNPSARQLFSTDGTVAGTQTLAGGQPIEPEWTFEDGALLVFTTTSAGIDLWRMDTLGEQRLGTFAGASAPSRPIPLGNDVLFGADSAVSGRELWSLRLGGPVVDLVSGSTGSGAGDDFLLRFKDRVYFDADDGIVGRELWSTDGTASGTQLEADMMPGPQSSNPKWPVDITTLLSFVATTGSGEELWFTDGTPTGLWEVDINPGPGSSGLSELVATERTVFAVPRVGGAFLFAYSSHLGLTTVYPNNPGVVAMAQVTQNLTMLATSLGREVSVTDGTQGGTINLGSFGPYFERSADIAGAHAGPSGKLLFAANTGSIGLEPFVVAARPSAITRGFGCSNRGIARLISDPPRRNASMRIELARATPGDAGLVLIGSPGRQVFGLGCVVSLSLAAPSIWLPVSVGVDGTASASLAIPDANFAGVVLSMQAVLGPGGIAGGGPALGYDLTNAVQLVF